MPDLSRPLHVAIVAALKADAPLSAIVGSGVYDRIPQSASFPYVQVTLDAAEAWDGVSFDGWEAVFRIDCWSRKAGQSGQAYDMGAAVYRVLHLADLTVASGVMVLGRLLPGGARLIRDDDAKTVHMEQRFRFLIDT